MNTYIQRLKLLTSNLQNREYLICNQEECICPDPAVDFPCEDCIDVEKIEKFMCDECCTV